MTAQTEDRAIDVDAWEVVLVSDPRKPLPRNAQILRLIDPERRVEYILGQPLVIAGRLPSADLMWEWPEISRVHCRLEWRRNRWRITDLESANGFYVNGTRQGDCDLRPGDSLTIADRTLEVDQIAVRELV